MTYELAKQLKDAEFPQSFKDGRYYAEKDLTFKEAQVAHYFFDERRRGTPEAELAVKKCISIPTLEELIEEAGDDFGILEKVSIVDDPEGRGIFKCRRRFAQDVLSDFEYIGSTPKEAVAKLCLIKLREHPR